MINLDDIEQVLGIDPDSRNQAFALLNRDGTIDEAFIAKSKSSDELDQVRSHINLPKPTKPFICIIEGQQVYKNDRKSNPDSIIKLSRASGIAAYWAAEQELCLSVEIVLPRVWKKSCSKQAKQAQILMSLGQTPVVKGSGSSMYCIPKDNFLDMNMTEYRHIIDAIGIAQWKIDQLDWAVKIERANNP